MNERNKKSLILGGIVLALFLLIQYVWVPAGKKISKLDKSHIQKLNELVQVRALVAQILGNKEPSSPPKLAASALIPALQPWLEQQLRQLSLSRYVHNNRIVRGGKGERARIELQNVTMEKLYPFLQLLAQESQISLIKADLKHSAENYLNVSLEISLNAQAAKGDLNDRR